MGESDVQPWGRIQLRWVCHPNSALEEGREMRQSSRVVVQIRKNIKRNERESERGNDCESQLNRAASVFERGDRQRSHRQTGRYGVAMSVYQ